MRALPFGPKALLMGLLALILSACNQPIITNGKYLTEDQAKTIYVGQSVEALLEEHGTPSYTSAVDENFWAYIGSRSQVRVFQNPLPLERRIFALQIRNGRVADVAFIELKDGKVIYPNTDQTPTNGRTISLTEELIGNIGRF